MSHIPDEPFLHSASLYLALVTGRTWSSVKGLVGDRRLPPPEYVCGSVGTELVACDDPDNAIGQKYAAQVSSEWNLEAIYALGEGEGIRRQEFLEGQPPFQAGFYWDGQPDTLAAFRSRSNALEELKAIERNDSEHRTSFKL